MRKLTFINTLHYAFAICIIGIMGLVVSSCIEEGENQVDGKGANRFRIVTEVDPDTESGLLVAPAAFDANPSTAPFIEIRRDVVNTAELNKPATITFEIDNTIVDAYNTYVDEYNAYVDEYNAEDLDGDGEPDNDPLDYIDIHYINPDPAIYSIETFTVDFAAGELVKVIPMQLDPSTMDFANQYALGVRIKNATSGYSLSEVGTESVVKIVVKNKYDGHYTVEGTMVDATNPALTGPYPWDVYLVTSNAAQVQVFDNDYTGDIFHKILSAGASSYYGAFGVVINFDDNNNVTSVTNLYGQPASNGRSAELDPSGVNKWDPVTKTLKIKYWMNQPGPTHRTLFDETFTYTGVR
jgi:hypothetical protein